MPYEITRFPNGKFQVINSVTGKIHAKQTTLKNAKKQLSLLECLAEDEGWRNEYEVPQMEGEGILNIASSLWNPATAEPPQMKRFLEQHGNEVIKKMFVRREPLSFLINILLSVLSWGEINRKINNSPYDELYHLSLYIETDAGTTFVIEKNQRINIIENPESNPFIEIIPVRLVKPITVNELIDNTKQLMGDKFYPYNPIYNNCQVFVTNILKANRLLVPITNQFINQDVSQIFNTSLVLKRIMDYIIYIGYVGDVVFQGGNI
jgi:hypothetical protein